MQQNLCKGDLLGERERSEDLGRTAVSQRETERERELASELQLGEGQSFYVQHTPGAPGSHNR